MSATDVLVAFLFVAFVVWRLSSIAGRLDRVHIRREQAHTSLQLQLAWRTSTIAKLISSSVLDPISQEILYREISAATNKSEGDFNDYIAAESELTRTLCKVFDDQEDVRVLAEDSQTYAVLQDLVHACRRVELARRFHNDAVGAAQLLHKRKIVRWFRLGGHTPVPQPIDMDDSIPEGLEWL